MEDIDGGLHPAVDGQSLGERGKKTMEDIDGGLHPAMDGQSLGERRQWKTLMEDYILQWMDKA